MRAAVAYDSAPVRRGPARRADGRADLRLVPTARGGQDAAPLRISRFGRLLVTLSVVTVVAVLAVSLLGVGAASATIDHRVTVTSGQTLSGIAAHELPELPVAEGVAQIQLANDLSSLEVHAGQQLAIPALG